MVQYDWTVCSIGHEHEYLMNSINTVVLIEFVHVHEHLGKAVCFCSNPGRVVILYVFESSVSSYRVRVVDLVNRFHTESNSLDSSLLFLCDWTLH